MRIKIFVKYLVDHSYGMSTIESSFDEYKEKLTSMLSGKVDPDLAMKIMYLERKLPDAIPNAELTITVKNDIVANRLKDHINEKFGLRASSNKNHVTVLGQTSIETLAKIASHKDIEWISGQANPASY